VSGCLSGKFLSVPGAALQIRPDLCLQKLRVNVLHHEIIPQNVINEANYIARNQHPVIDVRIRIRIQKTA
jgi:hypothetical protein